MPRTAVKHTEVFRFSELRDAAKQRACQWYREHGMHHTWWEFVYEDAKTVFALCGIEIESIQFTGFWSQGDGACFAGTWRADRVQPGKVQEHAPEDAELHRIAAEFERIAAAHPTMSFVVKHTGRYCHEYETEFEFEDDEDPYHDVVYGSAEFDTIGAHLAGVEKELKEAARSAMRWIYDTLEAEYEYQVSEEAVGEAAGLNGWEFTEDGDIYV